MITRSRVRNQPSPPSMAKLQFKLARIVTRHDQLKVSFVQLKAQIKSGLLEAEDVFTSLAVPLTTLVGLKTAEMAAEGRSSTIFTTDLPAQGYSRNEHVVAEEYGNKKIEEDYAARATIAGKELIQKQRLQLRQLTDLLKHIEGQVNSSQGSILQTINGHKASIHTCFQKAAAYVSTFNHSNKDNEAFHITLKLLKVTYDHVHKVLSSVEGGVQNLIRELAEEMCHPMVEYMKGVKAEMTSGTCPHLLAMLEEMSDSVRNGKLELEQARGMVRIAEERKHEALIKLKESEERVRRMKEHLGLYIKDKSECTEHFPKHKLIGRQEDQTKDDKLLWGLLEKKRKPELLPDSPFGAQELFSLGTNKKRVMSTRSSSSVCHRPATRSYLKAFSP